MTYEELYIAKLYIESELEKDKNCNEVKILTECVEKQTPKKPIWDRCNGEYRCSSCDVIMEAEYYNKLNFCGDCGQAIDWEEVE